MRWVCLILFALELTCFPALAGSALETAGGKLSGEPSGNTSGEPSGEPSGNTSGEPSGNTSGEPSGEPSGNTSGEPSAGHLSSETGGPQTSGLQDTAPVKARLEALDKELALAELADNPQTAQKYEVTQAELRLRTSRLKSARSTCQQQLEALAQLEALENERTVLALQLQHIQVGGIKQPPPYNLSFFDGILDELLSASQERVVLLLAAQLAREGAEQAERDLERAKKEQRTAADPATSPGKEGHSQWVLEKARAEIALAEARLGLQQAQCDTTDKQLEIQDLRIKILEVRRDWVSTRLAYDEADLTRQLVALENRRTDLTRQLEQLQKEQESAPAIEPGSESDSEAGDEIRESAIKAREAWRKTYQEAIEQTLDMRQLLERAQEIWKLRYTLVRGSVSRETLVQSRNELREHSAHLTRVVSTLQSGQATVLSQISTLEVQTALPGEVPRVKKHQLDQVKALKKLSEHRTEYISALWSIAQLEERVLGEIAPRIDWMDPQETFKSIRGHVRDFWDIEVWVIDNNAVTVRKLLVACLVLAVGLFVAKRLTRRVSRRLTTVGSLQRGTASAIQKIISYFIYLMVVLFALRTVNIPLDAFAFLGGALAIGLGFGAQNLLNNFISGFILMAERPISVGNIIELDGVIGQVEEVGARCVQVRTGENIRILVPNATLLERNIINWTHSDNLIRAHVSVGVAYGSPVRQVERLLLQAVNEHPSIIREQEPFVLFADFGNDALIFEVHFWIKVHQLLDRRRVESQLRFRIDDLFREAEIVIAFPQRDVHLDTSKPLAFRLLKDGSNGGDGGDGEESERLADVVAKAEDDQP